ncbi:MAG: septation protein IspZ [Tistlia sp.]|uniref:inner membrane-spanning protein YciB n=1 Tax=Tistlia sp. TaxID=3057121 RepID=UPI0034A21663
MSTFKERYLTQPVVLELLPAATFFLVNYGWGIQAATAAVIAATLGVVAVGYLTARRVPLIAVATLLIVLALGGASLLIDDPRFIKMKPTVGRCLFALALAVGLAFRPSFLERVLGGRLKLTRAGWRVLTFAWIAFALSLAALNEVVWRSVQTDSWVAFDTVVGPLALVGYVLIVRFVAPRCWDREAEAADRQ